MLKTGRYKDRSAFAFMIGLVIGFSAIFIAANALAMRVKEPFGRFNRLAGSDSHAPIVIDGESALAAFPDKTGAGTSSDPYLIKDLVIDASLNAAGISISNTTSYLVIRNCSTKYAMFNGIYTGNCQHLEITNCTLVLSQNGITLTGSGNRDIAITGCIIANNTSQGISLVSGSSSAIVMDVVISGNTIETNGWLGIYIFGSGTLVERNTIKGHPDAGFQVMGNMITASQNNISMNGKGIEWYGSYASLVGNQIVNNSGHGLAFNHFSYQDATGNTISHNNGSGVFLNDVYGATFIGNNVSGNLGWGFQVNDSGYCSFVENDLRNNGNGSVSEESFSLGNIYRANLCDPGDQCNNQFPENRLPPLYTTIGILTIVPPVIAGVIYKGAKLGKRGKPANSTPATPKGG
nr:right-handed parallel beta-helix repeat-containing protein [Candidatus Sigynarchaeota archaeon]